jgi:hypothetical protein
VWPLFTGWASVAEYQNHKPQPAYDNLRANAMLALDGSPGHVTEVLSGDFYQPISTSSPHQIWSAAMVISPFLRGMFGLHFDAQKHQLTFAPHVPADWTSFSVHQVAAGADTVAMRYSRTANSITVTATRTGGADFELDLSSAVSPRASILSVTFNGKPVAFHAEPHGDDQHVAVSAKLAAGDNVIKIHLRNDFAVTFAGELPSLGSISRGPRILSQSWNASHDTLMFQVQGLPGRVYSLAVLGKDQIRSLDGAALAGDDGIAVTFPVQAGAAEPQTQTVTIHFGGSASKPAKRGQD